MTLPPSSLPSFGKQEESLVPNINPNKGLSSEFSVSLVGEACSSMRIAACGAVEKRS